MAPLPARPECLTPDLLVRPAGDRAGGDWVLGAARLLLDRPASQAIMAILSRLGAAAGADRAWIFDYCDEHLGFRNSHEWAAPGVASFLHELQDVSVGMIGWLHAALMAGQAVMIPDIEQLPPAAAPMRAELRRQGCKAVLATPVLDAEARLVGALGFDVLGRPHRWSEGEIAALCDCAGLIGLARSGRSHPLSVPFASSSPPLFLRLTSGVRAVSTSDLVALRSDRDYVRLWLSDGSEFLDRRPISVWVGLLPEAKFQRIHRTGIVNLHHVLGLNRKAGERGDRWEVQLRALPSRWSVSRRYRAVLRGRLGV